MAYTTINKSTDYFNTKLWSGNGSTQTISGIGFQPDLVWYKSLNNTYGHRWQDSVRGVGNVIYSNASQGQDTNVTNMITAYNSDGYVLGADAGSNGSGINMGSWNWKANGAGSTNYDGSITSTVSANTTAGFSIVKYTGNGTVNSTIGHGLGTVPDFIIVKCLSSNGTAWGTKNPAYNSPSDPRVLYLNSTSSYDSAQNVWGTSASFTTSTFTVGDWIGSNTNSDDYIAYCWTAKTGYSKFGEYTGNGDADGTFVYTGFKPAFFLIKGTSNTESWIMWDNKRRNGANQSFNPQDGRLLPNLTNTEASANIDFLSNGFKLRETGAAWNGSSVNYIYMAFAEAPLVGSNNVPCTAR